MTVAKSEGDDKRIWNRYFRKRTRHNIITQSKHDLIDCPLSVRKATETWCGAKDGRQWLRPDKCVKFEWSAGCLLF
jgi:hypothetical protein